MVITGEQVQHCVTRTSSHGLDDLIWDGRYTRIVNGDSVEGLEVVHDAQFTTLLIDTEPTRPIGQVGRLVYSGGNILSEQLDDLL